MTTRLAARWRGLRRRLQNRRRWLIGTAAALVGLGIVGWLLFRDGPTAQAFRDLQARLADLQGDRVLLWRDCLDFRRRYPDSVEAAQVTGLLRQELFDYRRRYPGSPQARQAALLLPQLPSRLDELPGKPGEVVAQPPAGTPPVVSVAFSPDGSLIAAGCEDSTIYLWDPIANQVRTTLKGSTAATPAAVTALAFAPDGDRLVSGSMDGSLVLWDTAKGVELAVLKRYRPQPISLVCFAPDGQTLAVAVRGGRIALWDMAPPYRERLTHEGVGYQINSLSFSPDGQKLAALSATGSGVKVWTVAGQEQPAPKVSKPRALAISPDGRTLMVGGAEDRLLAWDLARSQGAPFELSKAISSIRAMIYTPDGKGLITSHERTLLAMWDAETAVKRLELRLDIHSMALAPDGRHLAVADDARRLTLLRLEMGPRP